MEKKNCVQLYLGMFQVDPFFIDEFCYCNVNLCIMITDFVLIFAPSKTKRTTNKTNKRTIVIN